MPSVHIDISEAVKGGHALESDPNNPLPNLLQTPSGLAIIEIQGTVNTPDTEVSEYSSDAGANGTETPVGRLVFPLYDPSLGSEDKSWMKRVYLYVGKHQRMTGEVKELAKPLAVLKAQTPSMYTKDPEKGDRTGTKRLPVRMDGVVESDSGSKESARTADSLVIADIIRFKILFASRPEPVGQEEEEG